LYVCVNISTHIYNMNIHERERRGGGGEKRVST